MAGERLEISFPETEPEVASRWRRELTEYIAQSAPGVDIKSKQTESDAQDFGAILILILGSKVTLEVAKGIADWLRHRNTAKVRIAVDGNMIDVDNISAKSAEAIAGRISALLSPSQRNG